MTEKGKPAHYLGMKFESTEGTSKISQPRHIVELLRDFGMQGAKPVSTPMDPGTYNALFDLKGRPSVEAGQAFTKKYQSAIGGLMYIAVGTEDQIADILQSLWRRKSLRGSGMNLE